MNRIGVALFAALMATTLFSEEAKAQSAPFGSSVERERVDYADLDVSSEAGAHILLNRIQRSAERVCGLQDSRRRGSDLRQRSFARACVQQAVEQAVAGVGSGRVQSVYADDGDRGARFPRTASVEYDGDDFRVVIPYAGYDLTSDSGRRSVSRTVERAARRACNTGLIVSRAERDCIRDALASGETQLAAAAQTQLASSAIPAPHSETLTVAGGAGSNGVGVASAPTHEAMRTGFGVCEPRALTATFTGPSAVLGQSARSELAYAVDSASVCRLDAVTVAVSGTGDLSRRRAEALRAALIRRGVPAQIVRVELGAAVTGPQVRMTFNGVASGETNESAPSTPAA